ncbi:MAG: hypothetical protein HY904_19075 [Deltaproteobacteria bacterium]|nr:hypothetical protein [Deltaproteobacteria bacterium]
MGSAAKLAGVMVGGWLLVGCGPRDACFPGQAGTVTRARRDIVGGHLRRAHAHNDYAHARPLEDALAQGFHSVEADTWLVGNALQVAHWPWEGFRGTLQELYLDPLQRRVDELGSVLGDGEPFVLWLDIKERNPAYVKALRDALEPYSMLSVFHADRVEERPVSVVLSGDRAVKRLVVESSGPVRASRDSNDYARDDPPADTRWTHYALEWDATVGWDGEGTIPAEALHQLRCTMENAHATGRRVRFYAVPEKPAAWDLLLDVGADLVSTDRLEELGAFLRSAP